MDEDAKAKVKKGSEMLEAKSDSIFTVSLIRYDREFHS